MRRRIITEAFNTMIGGKEQREVLKKQHKQERRAVGNLFAEQTKTEIKKINQNYRRRLDKLRQQQRAERAEQQKHHSEESQQRSEEIAEGKDAERFDPDAFRKARQDQRREDFRDTGRDISKKKPREIEEPEISAEQEQSEDREVSEERQRERQRQRSRRRSPRPRPRPKPPKFRH